MNDSKHRTAREDDVFRMVHDVGKYIARTAVNIGPFPVTPPLIELMIADLYRLDGTSRALEVFDARAAALLPHPLLDQCRDLIIEIDGLEARVRAYETAAVNEAARLALVVRETLLAWRDDLEKGER